MKQETIDRIRKFTDDRDWDQFHSAANLAKSIVIEAAELLECFQWNDEEYDLQHVKEELADVIGEFEDNGLPLLGGALGTDPRRLPEYFAAHGVDCVPRKKGTLSPGVYLCSYTALSLLQGGRGLHTVALHVTPSCVTVYNERDDAAAAAQYPTAAAFFKGKTVAALFCVSAAKNAHGA